MSDLAKLWTSQTARLREKLQTSTSESEEAFALATAIERSIDGTALKGDAEKMHEVRRQANLLQDPSELASARPDLAAFYTLAKKALAKERLGILGAGELWRSAALAIKSPFDDASRNVGKLIDPGAVTAGKKPGEILGGAVAMFARFEAIRLAGTEYAASQDARVAELGKSMIVTADYGRAGLMNEAGVNARLALEVFDGKVPVRELFPNHPALRRVLRGDREDTLPEVEKQAAREPEYHGPRPFSDLVHEVGTLRKSLTILERLAGVDRSKLEAMFSKSLEVVLRAEKQPPDESQAKQPVAQQNRKMLLRLVADPEFGQLLAQLHRPGEPPPTLKVQLAPETPDLVLSAGSAQIGAHDLSLVQLERLSALQFGEVWGVLQRPVEDIGRRIRNELSSRADARLAELREPPGYQPNGSLKLSNPVWTWV